MAINIGGGYHSKDKQGRPRSGEKVDELLDKIEDAKIENGTISIGDRSITPITEHQDISGKANVGDSYTKSESDNKYSTKQELNGKQDVIDDLLDIRNGAGKGATAYQKPSTGIPANDIAEGVIPDVSGFVEESVLAEVAFSGSYNDLSNKPEIPDVSDKVDRDELSEVATSGDYDDLENKPTIPAEQIQADWEQDDNSAKDYIKNKPNYAGSQSAGGPANKAVSIPFGQVDSTSTSTAFTATVDGITELRDGVCVYLRNGVVTSGTNCTLNINGLGAKPIYVSQAAASRMSTQFNANYTQLFVYNSSRVEGGCWDLFYGYDSDANTIGYDIRDYAIRKPVKNVLYRYQFLFTCMDGTLLPANSDNNVTAATHILTKESFNPFGQVYCYNSTTIVNAGANAASGTLQSQSTYVTPDFRYSFNTGATLTANNDIYIKCIPQPDGSAILADDAIVFALPTYEDGFIYKRLGKAYDTYRIILEQDKPVYYYKDGIKLWTGYNLQEGVMVTDEFTKKDSGVTSDVRVKSVGGKTVVWNQLLGGSEAKQTQNCTITNNADGSKTLNRTDSSALFWYRDDRTTYFQTNTTHRFYVRVDLKADVAGNVWIGGADSSLNVINGLFINPSVGTDYVKASYITSRDTTNNVGFVRFGCLTKSPIQSLTFKNLVAIDLTQMFGTGNEPSTVEEFEAMFPEESYAYDAGRIVNVDMTGMKSIDADGNDLDSAELDVTELTGVADGGSTSEIIFPNGMNGIGDVRDEIEFAGAKYEQLEYLETDGACAIATDLLLDGSEEWEIKFQSSKNPLTGSVAGSFNGSSAYTGSNVYIITNNLSSGIYSYSVYCDGQETSALYSWNGGNYADKLPHIIKYYGNVNTAPSIDGITMSPITSRTHTAVTPSIPWMLFGRVGSSITDIVYTTDGVRIFYFKGDGFNYIPCRRVSDGVLGFFDTVSEKFHTNVGTGTFRYGSIIGIVSRTKASAIRKIGVVDLGTLAYGTDGNGYVQGELADIKVVSATNVLSNILCAKYITDTQQNVYNKVTDKTMSGAISAQVRVYDTDFVGKTNQECKSSLSGVILYYELATPIEYTLDTTPSCVMSVVKGGKEMILPYNASEPQCAPARIVEEYKASGLSDKDLKNLATTAFVQEEISSQLGNIETLQIEHGTNDTTFELTPNVYHVWSTVASLTLTLGSGTSGIVNEYMFQFDSGSTATVLNLPNTISWVQTLTPEANKTYQVSIVNNIALWICV